jgi:hydantoinase/carbamoylase family amidase
VSVERTQDLVDSDGLALPAVLERCGVVLERIGRSASRLLDLDALLELHIEQGPVLESAGTALGIPTGAVAISRHRLTFIGRGGHAGTTPMDVRRDAGGAAARAALAAREAAVRHEGLATIGEFLLTPGVATAIPSTARISVDLRHKNDLGVNHLREDIIAQSRLIAVQESCRLDIDNVWSFPAVQFDEHVVAAVSAVVPNAGALVSGALHDAVAVARWGLPTAMLLVRSVGGISHSPEEHTSDSDVVVAVRAYASAIGELAERLSNSEGRARGVGP